jgi:hypothetical protein
MHSLSFFLSHTQTPSRLVPVLSGREPIGIQTTSTYYYLLELELDNQVYQIWEFFKKLLAVRCAKQWLDKKPTPPFHPPFLFDNAICGSVSISLPHFWSVT